jgi:hypothetical protein
VYAPARLESLYRAPEISGAQFRPNVAGARAIWRNCPARAQFEEIVPRARNLEKLSRARNVKQFVVRAWSWRNICTRARAMFEKISRRAINLVPRLFLSLGTRLARNFVKRD